MTAEVLMSSPLHYDVKYVINPWMKDNIEKVDAGLAMTQWSQLYEQVKKYSVVRLIKSPPTTPDMVFTANAGQTLGKHAVVSHFAKQERTPEEFEYRTWFLEKGYIVHQPKYTYEGQGDHLVDSLRRHWLGVGFRTERAAAGELSSILDVEINTLELADPRWYHLDTCFAPLPNGELVWYPPAFTAASQQKILRNFKKIIEISYEDACNFAANLVCFSNTVLLPKNQTLSNSLYELGYTPKEFDVSEFIKAGGAVKCLILELGQK